MIIEKMDANVVLATLVIYKVLLILIGFWAQRRVSSEQDFFLAGRQIGPWVGAISYAASAASAWTLLGMSGLAFSIGLSSVWVALGAVLGCVAAWYRGALRFRRRGREDEQNQRQREYRGSKTHRFLHGSAADLTLLPASPAGP